MFPVFGLSSFVCCKVLHLNISKVDVDQGVAIAMHVGSVRGRARSGSANDIRGGAGPLLGCLLVNPTLLEHSLARGHHPMLAPRIGRLGH
jgi:hypothetical protein